MNVSDIMTRDVACCSPSDTMEAAARRMWDRDCGCIPVVSDDRVVGMITDRDICMAALMQGRALSGMTVASAMARDPRTCRPTDAVADAERLMSEHQIRRLPVVGSRGELLGILSLNDVARAASTLRHERRPSVTEGEVARTLAATCIPRWHEAAPAMD